jgi:hypothetical protein
VVLEGSPSSCTGIGRPRRAGGRGDARGREEGRGLEKGTG